MLHVLSGFMEIISWKKPSFLSAINSLVNFLRKTAIILLILMHIPLCSHANEHSISMEQKPTKWEEEYVMEEIEESLIVNLNCNTSVVSFQEHCRIIE